MQRANIPLRYQKVWAVDAAGAYIRTVPVDSQIGVQDGAASFQTGFVPDNFSPVSAGGVPPFGQDFNGLLNVMTAWDQWKQAGGAVPFNSAFAAAVSGYPQGAIVDSNVVLGAQWYSTVDGNVTDPDDPLTSSGWVRVGLPVGALVAIPASVPTGFVQARGDFTIGSVSSGANYAAAETLFLYVANWANSLLAIYTSGGVATTRGANAVADFNANKRLQLPEGRGTGLIGVDASASSYLSGVPVVAGNSTTPGSTFGENLHQLTSSEVPPTSFNVTSGTESVTHTHSYVGPNGLTTGGGGWSGTGNILPNIGFFNTGNASVTHTHNVSGAINGGNGSHNNVERSLGVNWGQKL